MPELRKVELTPGELIGYRPTEFQKEFHRARRKQKYTVFIAHRRFGKTEACLAELITGCLTCPLPSPNFKYIAPTLKQAKEIAWSPLMKMISKMRQNGARGIEVSRTDARVVFNCAVNSPAVLQFSGLEEPENLRGGYDDGMIVDEAATMKSGIWGDVLVPRLADRNGWAVITGTVHGMDQLYDFYTLGVEGSEKYDSHWASLFYPISTTRGRIPWMSEDKLEALASGMGGTDSISWRQEMDLDWLANDGNLLIPLKGVQDAIARFIREEDILPAANVMGIDTSGHGSDKTVMIRRQGNLVYGKREFRDVDGLYLAGQVALEHKSKPLDAVFVDSTGGYGLSVVEHLRRMLSDVTIYEINFSSAATDNEHYLNKRAEMWDTMREWMNHGKLPNDLQMCKDLTNVRYEIYNGRLKLEEKKAVKLRLGRSPDTADALALTFAYPVVPVHTSYGEPSFTECYARDEFRIGV